MTEMPAWNNNQPMPESGELTHDELLETYIDRRRQGLPLDAESIIAQMIDELDEGEDIEPHSWLVDAITKAVNEFLAP